MGIGGISIWQLLIILAIILLVFGTKRVRNLGSDLGSAVKGFKTALNGNSAVEDKTEENITASNEAPTITTANATIKEDITDHNKQA